MIGLAAGTRIWIVAGVDETCGGGLPDSSGMVQTRCSRRIPFREQVFVFRGRRGGLIKGMAGRDGDGLCLFAKLTGARAFHLATGQRVASSRSRRRSASMLLEGIDWRRPVRTSAPQLAV